MRNVKIKDKKANVKITVRPKAEAGKAGSVGAPMPGLVVEVRAKIGQQVKKGQPLLVLSAMKMEVSVAAPKAGKLVALPINVGDNVAGGDLVAEIE